MAKPDVVITSRAERWCAAPRELILDCERDPHHLAHIEPRISVINVVGEAGAVGTTFTLKVTLLKVFRQTYAGMVMSEDPLIYEVSRNRLVEVSQVSVGAEPDDEGRYLVTYSTEARVTPRFGERWYYNAMSERAEKSGEGTTKRQLAASVERIEALARAV